MENEQMNMMNPEDAGRATDTVLGHLSLGELVIPRAFLDDPQVMQVMQAIFQAAGADINEFIVGHEANKINPETGYPEFFFKKIKNIFKKIAPFAGLALSLVPGLQGVGAALGSSILGAGAAGASTLGNALIGGGLGALGGGAKGGLLGALGGGIGANIGSLPGNNLPWLPAGMQPAGATSGSGILGAVGNATGLTTSNLGGLGSLGGGSSFGGLNTLASALGGFQQDKSLKKQQEQLLAAQQQQLGNLNNLNPTDVQNDPGYQFAQQQGEEALNRSLGAQGSLFSGQALKAASDFNTGLASKFYGDAYNRQAGLVGAQNDIYGNTGNIRAGATGARSNNISQSLANAFSPNVGGFNGGYISDAQLRELMRQRGMF